MSSSRTINAGKSKSTNGKKLEDTKNDSNTKLLKSSSSSSRRSNSAPKPHKKQKISISNTNKKCGIKKTNYLKPPKRALTPYMVFANSQRDILKKLHPDWEFGDLSTATSKMWKTMNSADKEPYEKISDKDKLRYAREMKKYVPPPESSESEEEESNSDRDSSDSDRTEDSEDEDASSSSEDEDEQEYTTVRRRGKKRSRSVLKEDGLGPGPPYSRTEYYVDVHEEPRLSPTLAKYIPSLSSSNFQQILHHRRRLKTSSASGKSHQWEALERSASLIDDTMTNNLDVSTASMAALPGFAKHVLLSQGRRALPSYVCISSSLPTRARSDNEIGIEWHKEETLQVGYNALSMKEVSKMKTVLNEPVNVGTLDLLSLPNYDELMNVPIQLIENCLEADKKLLGSDAFDDTKIPVSLKCIYLRLSKTKCGSKYDYCLLRKTTPWLSCSSEVLAILWEVQYVDRQ
jgi:hypothetical protein